MWRRWREHTKTRSEKAARLICDVRPMIEYTLDNGEELNKEFPETFFIPPRLKRDTLLPGELVKLIFRIWLGDETHVERMWVIVSSRTENGYTWTLDNDPLCTIKSCNREWG